jgi:hypothetical protein
MRGRAPMAEHPKLQNWVRHMETRESPPAVRDPLAFQLAPEALG